MKVLDHEYTVKSYLIYISLVFEIHLKNWFVMVEI